MRVRFNPAIGVLLIVVGGPLLVLSLETRPLVLPVDSLGRLLVLPAVLLLGVGLFFLSCPYFWVRDSTITVGGDRYYFTALQVEHGKVYAIAWDGRRTKVPIKRWLAWRADWRSTIEG